VSDTAEKQAVCGALEFRLGLHRGTHIDGHLSSIVDASSGADHKDRLNKTIRISIHLFQLNGGMAIWPSASVTFRHGWPNQDCLSFIEACR